MAEGVGTIDHAYISGPSHLRKTRGGNGNGNGNGNDDEEHELPTDIDEEEGSLSSSQSQHPQQGHEHEHGHGHGRGLETPSTFDDEPRLARIESNASRPREATELRELRRRRSSDSTSEASLSSNDYRATPRHIRSHTSTIRSTDGTVIDGVTGRPKRFQAIRRFWLRNINLEVPHKANRDYFALERTFLSYMRTSATFSMQGIFIAQLFRLQSPTTQQSTSRINFYSVGIPLSVAYQTCAILIAILGAYRFWRQQHAIAAEKALIGSWELRTIGVLTLFAISVLLILSLVIVAQS